MKLRYLPILFIILLCCPVIGLAEHTAFTLPGNTGQFALADGTIYVQSDGAWPQSTVWTYDPAQGAILQLTNQLQSEQDSFYALNGSLYKIALYQGEMQRILGNDGPETLSLIPGDLLKQDAIPFLTHMSEGGALTFVLACGDDFVLCRLDTETGIFQNVKMGDSLFAVQPYHENAVLVVRSTGNGKEVSALDWNTLDETAKMTLPQDAASIAYDRINDALCYLQGGALYRATFGGGNEKLMDGLPLWTDQRAFILENGQFVTLYSDLEEELIVIDLP